MDNLSLLNFKNEKDYLNKLQYFLNKLRSNKIDMKFIKDFYDAFIIYDNNEPLTNYCYEENNQVLLSFIPHSNLLKINLDSYLYTVNYIKESFKYLNDCINDIDFDNYIGIYVLLHELEHSYQYLIAEDKIDAPLIVACTYKLVYDYVYKERKIETFKEALKQRNRIKRFKKQCGHLVLERNANVEALNKTLELIKLENNKTEEILFEEALMANILMGYNDEREGALIETIKLLKLLPELKGVKEINDYNFYDKLRYGMPLNKEELEKLVNIILNSDANRFLNIKKNMRVKRK